MDLCTSSAISKLPQHILFSRPSPLIPTASLHPKKLTISHRNSGTSLEAIAKYYCSPKDQRNIELHVFVDLSSGTDLLYNGFLHFSTPSLRATISKETSISIDEKSGEAPDGVIMMEETPANEASGAYEAMSSEASKEASTGEQMQIFEFLNKLNLDSEDTYPLLVYGSGALVVLWLTSALVGAIDSIPVFPKLLEIVGLSYTIWFSSRYLLFKKNRDELFAKIEELKEEVLGSTDN